MSLCRVFASSGSGVPICAYVILFRVVVEYLFIVVCLQIVNFFHPQWTLRGSTGPGFHPLMTVKTAASATAIRNTALILNLLPQQKSLVATQVQNFTIFVWHIHRLLCGACSVVRFLVVSGVRHAAAVAREHRQRFFASCCGGAIAIFFFFFSGGLHGPLVDRNTIRAFAFHIAAALFHSVAPLANCAGLSFYINPPLPFVDPLFSIEDYK